MIKTFAIKGMHCASCASIIDSSLKKLDGLIDADINFATETARINYEPEIFSLEKMNEAISKLGYSLIPREDESHDRDISSGTKNPQTHQEGNTSSKEEKLEDLARMKKKVTFVLPFSLIVFALMLWNILWGFSGYAADMPLPTSVLDPVLLVLSTVILFWIGRPFLDGVVRFARYRVANMDTLIGIGTLSAYLYSAIIVLFPQAKTYFHLPDTTFFDVVIVVIGFVILGKYLEAKSKLQTGHAIEKLLGLQAKTALVLRDGFEKEIPISEVIIGDIIVIKPGTKIPIDGKIIEGKTSINESMITGEPIPADKVTGDTVIGGTINKQGSFRFEATKVGQDTMLAQIVRMVEEAQGSKAPIQTLADRIAAVFVPIVLVIALLSAAAWLVLGAPALGFPTALSYSILSFVGVLVIACPCALGLATPTAIIVGVGRGTEYGILIKNAESLEKLSHVDTIVLDKTGTITEGCMKVSDVIVSDTTSEEDILKYAASAEKFSEHPLAQAIVEEADKRKISLLSVSDFQSLEGVGIRASVQDKNVYVHKPAATDKYAALETLQKEGKTVVMIKLDGKMAGLIALSDTVKPEAKEIIARIQEKGIRIIMLTGDNALSANHIAGKVGIRETIADILPQEKASMIKKLQSEGKIVAMIGDGINDAPALAQADVGIAMANGTDVAIESAGITLLHGDMRKLAQAVELSQATMRTIRQNLFWAFIYNVIGIPVAAGLLYPLWGIVLNPAFAGLAMAGSSVSVVSNSLRLRTKKLS
jgi:Cu2+-exporting ATPase/Cu+-exporting ATPase